MEERTLCGLAVFCSLFGLALLFLISSIRDSTPVEITGLTIRDVGKNVHVCGKIVSKKTSKNHIFFDIEDESGRMKIVMFNTTTLRMVGDGINIYSPKNQRICLSGTLTEYPPGSGMLEIVYSGGNFMVE